MAIAAAGCGKTADPNTSNEADSQNAVYIDYASSIKLDMSSETLKQTVTVKTYVDGDTVHFYVPSSIVKDGVLKARFLAVNTPESTGKVEEYGKTASLFTREKLSAATSIIIESDDSKWNLDSTGVRYLVWIWYRTSETEEYRNLNIELLQNGLAIASSSANNRYGTTAVAAIDNAKALKLNIYSGEKDPNFYYGDAVELTLKELRLNVPDYAGIKVAFEGVITMNSDASIYIEEYDEETGMYNGISVYYGYGLSGEGLNILSVGNRVRIVGTCQYYEVGGTYQVSGLTYRQMKPDDPSNIKKISEGNEAAFVLTDLATLLDGTVSIDVDGTSVSYSYAELAQCTTVTLEDLNVTDIYTTSNPDSSSYGAMSLTCEKDGRSIIVRTAVLYDESGSMITEEEYLGKNITVKGIVDYYDGSYQIKVLSAKYITINH